MRKPRTKTIDGKEYTVAILNARQGYSMYLEIAKMVGPALADASASVDLNKGAKGLMDADAGTFLARAVGLLAGGLNSQQVMSIVNTLAENTLVNDMPLHRILDDHFAGDFIGMTKWLLFALEANFGNFSESLQDLVKRGEALMASKRPSVSPSI